MANTTAMSRLPLELWDQIFDHLVPNHEVTQEWPSVRPRVTSHGTRTQPAPVLRCTQGEGPALDMAVRALTDTPNLLFRGSHHRYWSTLIREAVWRVEWDPNGVRHPVDDLSKLVQYFGSSSSVRHVMLRIEGMFPFWPAYDDLEERATGATERATGASELGSHVIRKFRELRSFNIRIEVHGRGHAEEGDWLEYEMFRFLFKKSWGPRYKGNWKYALDEWGLKYFRVVVPTFKEITEDQLELFLEEDVTAVWSLGLEQHVEDYERGECTEEQLEELLRLVTSYGRDTSSMRHGKLYDGQRKNEPVEM